VRWAATKGEGNAKQGLVQSAARRIFPGAESHRQLKQQQQQQQREGSQMEEEKTLRAEGLLPSCQVHQSG
jgi:hypothetical protein